MSARPFLLLLLSVLAVPAAAIQDQTIIPTPRIVIRKTGVFPITSQMRIVLGNGTTSSDRRLAEIFNRHLETYARRPLSIVMEQSLRKLSKGSLYIATPGSDFLEQALHDTRSGLSIPLNPEGYLIDIRDDGVLLASRTVQGRFYGMMTLLDLLCADGRRLILPQWTIRDWPAHAQRGLRLIVDEPPSGLTETLDRLIPLCGRLKINRVEIVPMSRVRRDHDWKTMIERFRELSDDNYLDLALREDPETPAILLSFLPPGPEELALIASGTTSRDTGRSGFVPTFRHSPPSVFSSHWLGYVTAWTAENAWSDDAAALAQFSRAFFGGPGTTQARKAGALRNFTLLQQAPLRMSLDELWIRPSLHLPCLYSQSRRYAAETLAEAARAIPEADTSMISLAVSARIGFVDFVARRIRAEALLALPEATAYLRQEAVERVLHSLDQLAAGILDASRLAPANTQTGDVIAAVAFQRELWSRLQSCLERGAKPSDVLPPAAWMMAEFDIVSDSGTAPVLRRMVSLDEIPREAHLVVSASVPVVAKVNDTSVPAAPLLEEHSDPHRAVFVFNVSGLFGRGENLVELLFPGASALQNPISANLELGFRDGSYMSVGPDSLWHCSGVPFQAVSAPSAGPWRSVRIVPEPGCRSVFLPPR